MDIEHTDNTNRPQYRPQEPVRRNQTLNRQGPLVAPTAKEPPKFERVLDSVTRKSGLFGYAVAQGVKQQQQPIRELLSKANKHDDRGEPEEAQEKTDMRERPKAKARADEKKGEEKEEGGGTPKEGPSHRRVVGKGDTLSGQDQKGMGTDDHGGRGHSFSGQGQGSGKGLIAEIDFTRSVSSERPLILTPGSRNHPDSITRDLQANTSLAILPKAVLDQIVQQVVLVTRGPADKELQLEIKDRTFRGLRLRVRTRNGKVHVTFLTPTLPMRKLLEAHKGEILRGLGEKGIDVEGVRVILS